MEQLSAVRYRKSADVRFGLEADIAECETNVRFTPKSGHLDLAAKYVL